MRLKPCWETIQWSLDCWMWLHFCLFFETTSIHQILLDQPAGPWVKAMALNSLHSLSSGIWGVSNLILSLSVTFFFSGSVFMHFLTRVDLVHTQTTFHTKFSVMVCWHWLHLRHIHWQRNRNMCKINNWMSPNIISIISIK